jgi:adenylyl-sulfate kinase
MLPPAKYIFWLTGLPESGKTTIAKLLASWTASSYVIDGDEVREELCYDCGFTLEGRSENIRRVSWTAITLARAGITPFVALVSPLHLDRQKARERAGAAGFKFIEIYVATPLALCETRDRKGNYAKARRGEIPNFTGISAPYEVPFCPEIILRDPDAIQNASTVCEYMRRV